MRCDGCDHLVYSAPGGQQLAPEPHSRCGILHRNIPILLDEHRAWVRSAIPPECPIVAQGGRPGGAHSGALAISDGMVQWCVAMLDPNKYRVVRARDGTLLGRGKNAEVCGEPSPDAARRLEQARMITWERDTERGRPIERAVLTSVGRAVARASLPANRLAEHEAKMRAARAAGLLA